MRRLAGPLLLALPVIAMLSAGTGCDDEAPPSSEGEGGSGGCVIIGGAEATPEIVAFGQQAPDGSGFQEIASGGVADLIQPLQGGHVIFVGARVRGVCTKELEIRGRLRDARTGNYLAEDRRTHIDLAIASDGSYGEPAWDRISDLANVPICPNFLGRDMAGPEYELELRIGRKAGPFAEATLPITMACNAADPAMRRLCECECGPDYEFGKCEPGWKPTIEGLPTVLLSTFGRSLDDLWAAGGGLGNGPPAYLAHGSERAMIPLALDLPETLWWVTDDHAGGAWAVGEHGTILRAAGSVATPHESGTNATLFGAWAASETDAWAVGGTVSGAGDDDVVLRWDGASWSRVTLPDPRGVALYKVAGDGAGNVWMVGQGGAILRWDGAAFRWYDAPIGTTLFTVSANAGEVWAVGGPPAQLLRYDAVADAFVNEPLPGFASLLNGVSVAADGTVFVVGAGGAKFRRSGGVWQDDSMSEPAVNLHAVFAFDDGSAAAAGGDFFTGPTPNASRDGVLARYRP